MQFDDRTHKRAWIANAALEKALPADTIDIVAVNHQFNLPIPEFRWDTAEFVSNQIVMGNYYVLRESGGKSAAALCWRSLEDGTAGYIETIAVRKDLQGCGLGRRLIEEAEALARAAGFGRLVVESFCAYELTGFYKACGFTQDPKTGDFKGHKYYRFSKGLELL